ncbi:MAG: carboxynorspermidine decarboxylase [Acetanaerobacterium sp.]
MKLDFNTADVSTPCYVVDRSLLEQNLTRLRAVADRTGCRILLAQKAFSMYYFYPLIARYLHGTTASGVYEARLGHDSMGGETHIFSPAYTEREFEEAARLCGHIVFNSFSQWERFRPRAMQLRQQGKSFGIRINPECSTQEHGIYDPCAAFSRLGVTAENFREDLLDGIEGMHFHTLCEQNADALQTTLDAVEHRFGRYLGRMKWVNFGGGHHITRADYDTSRLERQITRFSQRYGVQVYLEPGEAVALNAGYLVATVLDVLYNGMPIAILDASAACHMPDVLEMPYRPEIIGAGAAQQKEYTYRLGGPTCLAGDIIGDYSFDAPLCAGDRLVFCDMAHYTMVKNNTFNGMPLPDIYAAEAGKLVLVKRFGYEEFKNRLS